MVGEISLASTSIGIFAQFELVVTDDMPCKAWWQGLVLGKFC